MTNQSKATGKRKLKALMSVVIALLLAITVFEITAFADTFNSYDVTIVNGGEEITISTSETEPIEILNSANIELSQDDKLDITSFIEGEGGKIVISKLKNININFEGDIQNYSVYASTVDEALKEAGVVVPQGDLADYPLDSEVKDGMVISIKKQFAVTLVADGEEKELVFVDGIVADALNEAGVELGKDDFTNPSLDTELKEDMTVTVCRVSFKNETKTEDVKFKTVEKEDKTLEKGKTKTVTEGENGSKEVTYKVRYVNGKKESSEKVSEKITKEATDEVVNVGTKKVEKKKEEATKKASKKKKKSKDKKSKDSSNSDVKDNGVKSKDGYSVGQTISGRYTHYCACATCNGNSNGITSSGKKIYNGMKNPYYVACNWLPLGSVINVDGQNYTVVDRGGSGLSREGRIDIFTPGGHSDCYRLGTGSCTIKIVRLGW